MNTNSQGTTSVGGKTSGSSVNSACAPWHRVQPARDRWEWSFADQTLEHLLDWGIEPIVDLVHYGLPPWIENAYLNPDFPKHMAEYAFRLATRFKGRIRAYTPLNEPRITAWYCGKLGWWPPFRRGWTGFVEVMLGVCRGIVQTVEALRAVDPDILFVHVDATDLYESPDPALADEVRRRQDIVFLALDLVSGRVDHEHSLFKWLVGRGVHDEDLRIFHDHHVDLPLVGINLYPMFSRKILSRTNRRLRIRMPYASAEIVERLAELYWQRYNAPLIISETASVDSVRRRRDWLESSVAATRRVRERGIPLVGYTWWPMFSLVTWGYRQGTHPPEYYLKHMGFWDIAPDPAANLRRVRTPLADEFARLVAGGAASVGTLARQPEPRREYVS
jgi:beta-glucosidase